MMRIQICENTAKRLNKFLTSEGFNLTLLSNHWDHYKKLSTIGILPNVNIVSINAGAGFDDEYELNFRRRTFYEFAAHLNRRLLHRYDAVGAFKKMWSASKPVIRLSTLEGPLTIHKAISAHYVNSIYPHLKRHDDFCYLEIGAGTGYLAVMMHRLTGGRTFIIDLPDIIPFSFLYINKAFPKADFLLPHEVSRENIASMKSGFIFLTPQQLHTIHDRSIDLAVNTASFGEMIPEQIEIYFTFLRRVLKKENLFYTTNRVEKWMSRPGVSADKNGPERGMPIRFHEYPWRSDDKDVFFYLSEFHAYIQPQNPMFSRLTKLATLDS